MKNSPVYRDFLHLTQKIIELANEDIKRGKFETTELAIKSLQALTALWQKTD